MVVKKDIFKILEKKYVEKLLQKKKNLYFPFLKNKKILNIQIEKKTPGWVKESCLARYKIFFSDSSTKTVWATAKIGESKKRTFEVLNHLYSQGFDQGFFQVPQPLDYLKQQNALFYRGAKGNSLQLLLEKKKLPLRLFRKLAEFLFQIHSQGFKKVKAKNLKLKDYKQCLSKLKELTPFYRSRCPSPKKINFLKELEKGNNFIHGDFYPSNIIIGQNQIFLIDFDKAGKGNFLLDLLSFYFWFELPRIKSFQLSPREIQKRREVFLRHYCQLANLNFPEIKSELKRFKAKIFLNCLHYVVFRALRGWGKIDQKLKKEFILSLGTLLKKTNQSLQI